MLFLFFFVVVNVFSSRSLFEQFFVASEFKPINTRPMNFNDPPEIKDTPFVLPVRFSTSLVRPRMVVRHPPNRRRCLPWFFFLFDCDINERKTRDYSANYNPALGAGRFKNESVFF